MSEKPVRKPASTTAILVSFSMEQPIVAASFPT